MRRTHRALGATLGAAALALSAISGVSASAAAPQADNISAQAAASARGGSAVRALVAQMRATVRAGATGVIVRVDRGHHVTARGVGRRLLEPAQHIRTTDEVRVGSITKSMVATVTLQLVGEGRLHLGDTVDDWLPGLVPNGDQITLRMLLNHTSGIYDYSRDPDFGSAVLANPYRQWSPKELVAIATAHDPVFAPGEGWSYSNTNYILVGLILQKATGKSVQSLLRDRVIGPLHLHHTYFATTARFRGPYAHGYLPPSLTGDGYVDVSHWSPSITWAAGAVVSNARDLSRFYEALLAGRLLTPWLLRQMTRTVDTGQGFGYGLGLFRQDTPCGTLWGHDGHVPGYLSFAYTDPTGSRSAVVFLPTEADDAIAQAGLPVLEQALCLMFGKRVPTGTGAVPMPRSLLKVG